MAMGLFERIQRALFVRRVCLPAEFRHQRLGTLRRDEDHWTVTIPHDGAELTFQLGGTGVPSPPLLRHAVEIAGDLRSFQQRVATFLRQEAERAPRPEIADEIEQLRPSEICLHWPERPDDGMIYFSGGKELRLWRCDYVARQPRHLGFDT